MIYVLFVLIILLSLFNYWFQKKDYFSASFLACIMFAFSVFINLINAYRWGTDYSWKAIRIIVLGLLMLSIGEHIIKSNFIIRVKKNHVYDDIKGKKCYPIIINFTTMMIIIIISGICFWTGLKNLAKRLGTNEVFLSLRTARRLFTSGKINTGFAGRFTFSINKAIALIMIYIILYNIIICSKRLAISHIIPILIFAFQAIFSTGRTVYLRFIAYTFIVYGVLYVYKNGNRRRAHKKIIVIAVISLILFAIVFTYAGRVLGKGIYNSPIDVFYYYSGSSINLFNQYITRDMFQKNTIFGEHTLYGIYNALHYINPNIEHVVNPALEFTFIPNWNSNIYTAFRRYYQDYGIWGTMVICFFLGNYYGILETHAFKNIENGWKTIFYAYSMYPIIEIAIEERFLINYISFTTAFEMVTMYAMYMYITKFKFRINNKG